MNENRLRRYRKRLMLGIAGLVGGIVMLVLFCSLPTASGGAPATMIAIVALKHLVLFIAISLPAAALLQAVKPRLRA